MKTTKKKTPRPATRKELSAMRQALTKAMPELNGFTNAECQDWIDLYNGKSRRLS